MVKNLFIKQSLIGYAIKIAGVVVMVWGVIQGIFTLTMMAQMGGHITNEWGEMHMSSGLSGAALFAFIGIVASHFLYGLLIIGFGEVIDLLQKIYFRLHPEAEQAWVKEQEEKEVVPPSDIPYWVQKEIEAYYTKQELAVQSIEKTSDPYIFKVNVKDRTDFIEVGDFAPRILSDDEAKKFIE
ncbi:hypothetical protein [Sporosarcina highlanderae]|uniref:Uncharacterized protein n=1 Tax=Sporosarcina highlanderae TaxID=3035916 RepID=A0ABT8JNA4_9BACL|nr:hypothetical protein [Sporosarcina highlanderae]MDN4606638.1 hypothetical protein [Sporosarcina highlanderae]